MSARVVTEACIAMPILGSVLDAQGIEQHPGIRLAVTEALRALQIAADVVRADG